MLLTSTDAIFIVSNTGNRSCVRTGVHVYRAVCYDQTHNVYHVNCSLLATDTVADIQVSSYEGSPDSLIRMAAEGETFTQPTPIMQLTENAGTTSFSQEEDCAPAKPYATEKLSLASQNSHAVHSTSTQVC